MAEEVQDHAMEGNQMKMREAILKIQEYAETMDADDWNVLAILDACRDALSAPARQCDMGTAEEQMKRFDEFTSKYWPLGMFALQWAQMPYEAEEGGAE